MSYSLKQYFGLFLLALGSFSSNLLFTVDGSSYGTIIQGLVPVVPVLLGFVGAMMFASEEVKDR